MSFVLALPDPVRYEIEKLDLAEGIKAELCELVIGKLREWPPLRSDSIYRSYEFHVREYSFYCRIGAMIRNDRLLIVGCVFECLGYGNLDSAG